MYKKDLIQILLVKFVTWLTIIDITHNVIALGYPGEKLEGIYRNPMSEVRKFFKKKHAGCYKIYNLCRERAYDPKNFENVNQ